ncbi:hypothetical protein GCM10007158_12220 [Vreelandella hamiltonii]|uniref:Uncharacterized protein n=1 Tax=Halomonas johnsoniae TaxID=502832 RepID=A0ABQ2WF37_9GAMM|nr:hypothetical protein GCM10007158_12220 [Halomonas johnsoniae]
MSNIPVNATWEDLMHEIYIRETIEKGMANSQAGNITSVADIRKKYGLPE